MLNTYINTRMLSTNILYVFNICAFSWNKNKISYMKKIYGRLTGLVTFCVETAFNNGLLKER